MARHARARGGEDGVLAIEKMILASSGGFAPANETRQLLNSYDGSAST